VLICASPQFVYLEMPKCGSTAVREFILRNYRVQQRDRHGNRIPKPNQSYFTFGNCRNPYTRAVSLWWGLVGEGPPGMTNWVPKLPRRMPWQDFLAWYLGDRTYPPPHTVDQSKFLIRTTAILRMEHLSDDFAALPFVQAPVELPPTNIHSSTGRAPPPMSELYDQDTADWVYRSLQADFEFLGYERDSWKGIHHER